MMKTGLIYSLCLGAVLLMGGCSRGLEYEGSWAQVSDILDRVQPPSFPDREFNVASYGALSGGEGDSRPAIQAAIAACSESGGGRVVVPAGLFVCNGPIHLDDDVDLHLSEGARVVFGTDPQFYLPAVLTRWEGTIIYNYSPFVYAYRKRNIALTGSGILDGQAKSTWSPWNKLASAAKEATRTMNNEGAPIAERVFGEGDFLRPSFVQFYECENILVEDVQLVDSPFWCIHPVFSRNITVRNMRFTSHNPNNDGIDPDSCEDVYIHDVMFGNGDDNIAIKSGRDREARELGRPSRGIYIRDCVFNNYTGIAVGSEVGGSAYDIFAENCHAESLVKRGLYVKSNRDRGGEVARVRFRNMSFLDAWEQMLNIGSDYGDEQGYGQPPLFRDIRIENVTATGPCKVGLHLYGQPEYPHRDIVLANISIDQAEIPAEIENVDTLYMRNVWVNGKAVAPEEGNLPPDIYAGADRSAKLGEGLALKASVLDDHMESGALSYRWSVIEGSAGGVEFANPSVAETSAVFRKAGRYVLQLEVGDGELTATDALVVQVSEGG